MKKLITLVATPLLAILLLASASTAEAARSDARQRHQAVRIADGKRSGELTRREAKKVVRQQRHIRRVERRARADGHVSAAERARIERKQDRASRNIYRKKHNRRSR